jgi:DNA mismatch endonuclease (patch repair protein)
MRHYLRRPEEKVSNRMREIKSSGTQLEARMESILGQLKMPFERQPKIEGRPDFKIKGTSVLIFCDSSFWHGRLLKDISGKSFKRNKSYWKHKLLRNKLRDTKVSRALRNSGWSVQRFWDTDIEMRPNKVKRRLLRIISSPRNFFATHPTGLPEVSFK